MTKRKKNRVDRKENEQLFLIICRIYLGNVKQTVEKIWLVSCQLLWSVLHFDKRMTFSNVRHTLTWKTRQLE